MKKTAVLLLIACLLVSAASAALSEEPKFVTVREWLDAKGECGDCMLLLKIQAILNPVLAIAGDETGTVNLYSGTGPDTLIVNFLGDELPDGWLFVIANPRYNLYENTVEMADWTLLRMMPYPDPIE